jgi:TatD DNase family protein
MIPLDAHAHVALRASAREVSGIAPAIVLSVTGSPADWPEALKRHDDRVVWGIGCHPGDERALRHYDERAFARAAGSAGFVGEVGLDARSGASLEMQSAVFSSVLRVAAAEGLIVSAHSVGRINELLNVAERFPGASLVLHWWTGTEDQTARAVSLGCYFSINGTARRHVLAALPRDRVLTETDFPYTRRTDPTATGPGRVARALALLSSSWQETPAEVVDRTWRTLATLDVAGRLSAKSTAIKAQVAEVAKAAVEGGQLLR